jgi:DNA repair protein RadD
VFANPASHGRAKEPKGVFSMSLTCLPYQNQHTASTIAAIAGVHSLFGGLGLESPAIVALEPPGRIALRPYQTAALDALYEYLLASTGFPLVDMATGTGKSLVIAAAVHRLAWENSNARFLVLAPRLELIEQDVAAIHTLWPDAPVGIVCEGLDQHDWQARIVVATVNSVYRRAEKLGPRDIVFVDEAHLIPHGDEGMFQTAFAALLNLQPAMRIVGLTATPYRLDSGRLDEGEGRLFDQIIFEYGIADAVADGWLAPLTAKAPIDRARIDTSRVHKIAGEFNAGELERAADRPELIDAAAGEIVVYGGGRVSWLAFCCGVDHAVHVRDALRERGIRCETVTGKTPDAQRRSIVEAFRHGEIECLTGADIFITGFDIAQVDLIALLRPTLSTSRYVQMVGRGTRKAAGKENCLVLDFGGNVMRHGPVDNPTICISNRGNHQDQAKLCPQCRTFNAVAATHCIECDYEFTEGSREAAHDGVASSLAVLGGDAEWINVEVYSLAIHEKSGRPRSFKVTYSNGVREWLAFSHSPGARWHAARKWQQLGGAMPAPADADEALRRKRELARNVDILATFDGKFWQVNQRRVAESGHA